MAEDDPKERRNFTLSPDSIELLEKLATRANQSRSAYLDELIRVTAAKERSPSLSWLTGVTRSPV